MRLITKLRDYEQVVQNRHGVKSWQCTLHAALRVYTWCSETSHPQLCSSRSRQLLFPNTFSFWKLGRQKVIRGSQHLCRLNAFYKQHQEPTIINQNTSEIREPQNQYQMSIRSIFLQLQVSKETNFELINLKIISLQHQDIFPLGCCDHSYFPLCFYNQVWSHSSRSSTGEAFINCRSCESNCDSPTMRTCVPKVPNMIDYIFSTHLQLSSNGK